MAAWSDYAENKLIDFFFRAQALGITGASAGAGTGPTDIWVGLLTTVQNDANSGAVEVSTGSYARVRVTASLQNWAGTQSTGSTAVSSGTGGTTSNNNVITFPSPTANWGSIQGCAAFDASAAGNLLFHATIAPKTVNSGDPAPSFAAGAITFQIDN